MELAHIKYFLAVCEARHFTRAAIACGISQPSLSVAIGRLEKALGEPLFDRGPPVRLTPLGEAVKPHFRTIWRNIIQIRRLAETRVPERTGRRSQIGIQRKQEIASISHTCPAE
jgi:LysR family hydrogen peroxide-inducible transcriptional activator